MIILKEETVDNPTIEDRFSVLIQRCIHDEQTAIELYELLLNHPNITDKQKEQVTEILNDEKDHLVIFSEMIPEQVKNEFPNSGEK